MLRSFLSLFGIVSLFILAGCGSGQSQLVPVEGRVFLRGLPVSNGTIVFVPDEEKGHLGRMAAAVIEPGGVFHLMTDKLPGAEAGWYRVTIALTETPGGTKLPKRYSDPAKSGVVREVKPGIPNSFDIQLD